MARIKAVSLFLLGLTAGVWFSSAAAQQTCVRAPQNLISWWPGDGDPKDIADGNDGTLQNGATFASGKVGQAFLLDGVDDFVDLGNAPNLQVSAGNFTVDAWVLFNFLSHPPGSNLAGAPQGDMSILDKMSDGGVNADGWRLLKQDDNRFWFCFGGGGNLCGIGSHTVFSTTRAVVGTWFHVAVVKDASSFSIYVNGVQQDVRSPVPSFVDTNSANLRIGSYILEGAHLNGEVDEVEVFNRALNAQEIQDIFNAGSAGKCKVQTPATLTLTPPAATNPVGTQHCVTATVQDAAENPVSSVAVQFAVAGSVNTDESVVTDANGQATLCYSGPALPGGDTITAFADTDGDTVQDSNEPGDAAAKTWVTPAATLGHVTGGGQVASAVFSISAQNTTNQGPKGRCNIVDKAAAIHLKCVDVTSLTVSADAKQAKIFGQAEQNGLATTYVIEVRDLGEPGTGDSFMIQTASGYIVSGTLASGNIQIHR